ncbi:chitin deacetylase 8-like [Epargyreus clarus]|uniref:chitin deacetylase 8-like n=1 Tax=Epargyreus clarus TaxID=520877 RepID=UPI003C2B2EE1
MKWALVAFTLLLVASAIAEEVGNDLEIAKECNEATCILPNCRCSSTDIPGGLDPRDTPQLVLLTFDDGVNVVNVQKYRTLYGRKNKNGCPIGVTYFVNHEYTNYRLVNELYNMGFEIALHSISHQTPQTYWAEATYETMMREFADQKRQMAHFANIPINDIHGMRIPFLQMSGNSSFQMMNSAGLTYDSSWPTSRFTNPGLWPYTLDYASTQDCMIPPCPTASIPGPWVLPLITWFDLNGFPCSFVDACIFRPDINDEEAWFRFIMGNFERHYKGNRAPFGFYVHEWFITSTPAIRRAFTRFLDLLNNLHDVFMVNASEAIEFARNPVKIDEYKKKACRSRPFAPCPFKSCGPLTAEHTLMTYWMEVCTACPNVYPWLGNPLGN